MRDLSRFLDNPFDDPGVSLDELVAFTTDHVGRMTANNPGGIFTARLAATATALAGVEDSTTDDQVKAGLRKARKLAKDAFRKSLPASVAMIHAVVVAKYGPTAPEVAECFPQGRKVFSDCTDDHVDNHLETMIAGVTAHVADLGAQVVTDAEALLTGWNAVYGTSESSSGDKSMSEAERRAARAALQLVLFQNLLTIAMNYPRQPEMLPQFMQQSLLEDHPISAPPPTPPPPGP